MTPTDSAEKVVAELRRSLAGVTCDAFGGDNLVIFLASEFEPGVDSDDLDGSGTWKQGALDLADSVLDAIHAHYSALIESQRATIERVERERDEADRRAGAAERDNAHRREADVKRQDWLDERKRALGYETGISFDRVWDDTLAKANRAEAAKARVTALEVVLRKFLDFADAEYVPNTLFDRARAALSRSSSEVKNDEAQ